MALIKRHEFNNSGLFAEYIRLAEVEIHWGERRGTAKFNEYLSAQHRLDGKGPVANGITPYSFGDHFDEGGAQQAGIPAWPYKENWRKFGITLDIPQASGAVLAHHVIGYTHANWLNMTGRIATLSWLDKAAFDAGKKPAVLTPTYLNFSTEDWPFVDDTGKDKLGLRAAYTAALATPRYSGGKLIAPGTASRELGRKGLYDMSKTLTVFTDAADG